MHRETSFRLQKDWLKSEFYSKRYVRLNTEVLCPISYHVENARLDPKMQ